MTIFQGMPPYTETNGKATIRKGKDCVPFTGSMRTEVFNSTGISDFSSNTIEASWKECFSAVAMESYVDSENKVTTIVPTFRNFIKNLNDKGINVYVDQ